MRFKGLKVFLFFALVNGLLHAYFINLPPCGSHVWRQCNTLAMSRNFATESMDIMHPRIDRRNNSNGITGAHFPAYEWTLALISKAFGFTDLLARVFSLLVFTLGMFAFYLFLKQVEFDDRYAVIGSLMLLSIPQNYYDSMNAMPDIMALTASLFSLYFLTHYFKNGSIIHFVIGVLLAVVCGLIKFQFLILPLSSIVYLRYNKKEIIFLTIGALIVSLTVVFWYLYAIELSNSNNLKEFGLWIKPISLSDKLKTVQGNLVSDLPELLMGWPLFVLFLALLRFIRPFTKLGFQILIGIVGFVVFYIVAIERMQHHSYYFMALLPFLVLMVLNLFLKSNINFRFLLLFCCLNFIWSFARIIPSRWANGGKGIPEEFKNTEQRNKLTKAMKSAKISLVGPDVSGCIFFYFINAKGYSFDNFDELFEKREHVSKFDEMRLNGLDRLLIDRTISNSENFKSIQGKRLIDRVGNFEIWTVSNLKAVE